MIRKTLSLVAAGLLTLASATATTRAADDASTQPPTAATGIANPSLPAEASAFKKVLAQVRPSDAAKRIDRREAEKKKMEGLHHGHPLPLPGGVLPKRVDLHHAHPRPLPGGVLPKRVDLHHAHPRPLPVR
jgi:hypothetical protein